MREMKTLGLLVLLVATFVIPVTPAISLPLDCEFIDGLDPLGNFYYVVRCPKANSSGFSIGDGLRLERLESLENSTIRGKDLVKFHEQLAMEKGLNFSSIVDASKISGIRSTVFFTLISEVRPSGVISYYSRLGYDCYVSHIDAGKCWETSINELRAVSSAAQRTIIDEMWGPHVECETISCLFTKTSEKKRLSIAISLSNSGSAQSTRVEACKMLDSNFFCYKNLM
jgi:hypothetical protein